MGFDKTRPLEKFSGLARAKGPTRYNSPVRGEISDNEKAIQRGKDRFAAAGVETGFYIRIFLTKGGNKLRKEPREGIAQCNPDFVTGETASLLVNGQLVYWETIGKIEVLMGRKTTVPIRVPVE